MTTFLVLLIVAIGIAIYIFTRTSDGNPTDLQWDALTRDHWNQIDMDDYTMHYIDMGKGEPVFLIHGFSSSTYAWHKTATTLLDAGFRVILMDLPGCGRSSIPSSNVKLRVDYMAGQVVRLADELSIDQFSIVGASMGGGISLYLLVNYPDRISRGVVIDPACYMQKHPAGLWLLNHPIIGKFTRPFIGKKSISKTVQSTFYDKSKCSKTLKAEFARPTAKQGYQELPPRLLSEFVSDGIEEMIQRYNEIKAPVLILWGENDVWISPEFGKQLEKDVPGAKMVKIGCCGHMPHVEQAEKANPMIADFLRSVEGAGYVEEAR